MKHRISQTAIATLLAASFVGPVWADQYVCQTEQMTGFVSDGHGEWTDTRFTNRPTYLVDTESLTVTEFGQGIKYTNLQCEVGSEIMPDWITCSNSIGTSHFTFKSGFRRFAEASIFGSVGSTVQEPWVAIGACAELGN